MRTTNNRPPGDGTINRAPGGYGAEPAGAPPVDWGAVAEAGHFAQFYEADAGLVQTVGDFIAAGLRLGEGAVVLATSAHRTALAAGLRESGVDVDGAEASGQLVLLDAAATLARFMVDGVPDPARFAAVVGEILAQAVGRPRRRLFGEMVAVLWAEQNYAAALRLEELWNQLQARYGFVLFCAYPLDGFDDAALAQPLRDVCAAHAHVIPAESYAALPSAADRQLAIILLQQKARLLEAEIAERQATEETLRALQRRLQQELAQREALLSGERQARADAERAIRAKDEFLATVSHELRTPLTTIVAWAQLLQRGGRSEAAVARGLDMIERSAKAQSQLVDDILDVSLAGRGQLGLQVEPVDVAAVLTAALDGVQLAAEAKGIQVGVTFDPLARHVLGDAGRLNQVFWNLLSNAIRFTPAGGRVDVRLERAGADLQVSVSDTGEGITAEFLPFLFDRFRQADGTPTRRHGGLGLGLAIVRHLVESHGGTVEAESAGAGAGATFRVRLPLERRVSAI